jgi:hypothetical protein
LRRLYRLFRGLAACSRTIAAAERLRANKAISPDGLYLLVRAAVFKQAGEAKEAAAALKQITGKESLDGWREREIARLLRQ